MKVFSIGELIKQRRSECGFTQVQLCTGICEPPTMSRIERGYTTPSRSKLTALLQRLGLSGDKYYALLSDNELEIARLQNEITSYAIHHDYETGLVKLEQLEKLREADDHILEQYILKTRVGLGKRVDGHIEAYSFDERLALLNEAILLTVPNFDIDNISNYVLGCDEIQLINQIAATYGYVEKHVEEMDIYRNLMNYIEKHKTIFSYDFTVFPVAILISYNYARTLYLNNNYIEALSVAETCLSYSKELRNSTYLAGALFIQAFCLYQLGQVANSRKKFFQSYYMYQIVDDIEGASHVHDTIKDLFQIEPDF